MVTIKEYPSPRLTWITIRHDSAEWSIPLVWITSRLSNGTADNIAQVRHYAGLHGITLDQIHRALNDVARRRNALQGGTLIDHNEEVSI